MIRLKKYECSMGKTTYKNFNVFSFVIDKSGKFQFN